MQKIIFIGAYAILTILNSYINNSIGVLIWGVATGVLVILYLIFDMNFFDVDYKLDKLKRRLECRIAYQRGQNDMLEKINRDIKRKTNKLRK